VKQIGNKQGQNQIQGFFPFGYAQGQNDRRFPPRRFSSAALYFCSVFFRGVCDDAAFVEMR
jgi:hypothetical protein